MNLKLVKCEPMYWEFVRKLRNDSNNLEGFVKTNFITEQDQIKYMSEYQKYYYICLSDNIPVGFIGEINGDIRICTDHNFKNNGIGKFMVNELLKLNSNVFAKIKVTNDISLKLFKSCGFELKYLILEPTK